VGHSTGISRQRGSVVLYLLFSIAASIAAGYGVYLLLRERNHASAATPDVAEAPPARAPAPRPVAPEPTPVADTPPDLIEPDAAERGAVAPEIADVDKDAVLLGTPGVSGGLEAAQVERTIKRYTVRYERCMRRSKERGEEPRGELRLTLVLGPDGDVEFATGKPTNLSDELASCIVDVVQKLRFDKTSDGMKAKVVYPLAVVVVPRSGDPL
jgi:hypothetical protein